MGTWGDRSRTQFAPPPAPFAIPPAGVPGGRLGPSPNRMNAGYHSLQYTPPPIMPPHHGGPPTHHGGPPHGGPPNGVYPEGGYKVLEKKGSASSTMTNSSKYSSSRSSSRDGSDQQLHKLPQVKAFVSQVEQSAKKQLKSKSSSSSSSSAPKVSSSTPKVSSSAPKVHHQTSWIDSHPNVQVTKSPSVVIHQNESKKVKSKPEIAAQEHTNNSEKDHKRKDSKAMVLAASKNPAGRDSVSPEVVPEIPPKPQFYFGQTMTDLVKKSSIPNGYQTAIDKVKQNEALTHPKRNDAEKLAAVMEMTKKGRHMSIITVSDDPNSINNKTSEKKINSQKAASLSSGVSSLSSSSSSSSSSTRSSPAKENNLSTPSPPLIKQKINVEPTQDSIRKAFEAQLMAGKNRLKKVEDDVGQVPKLPPAPVPPPPPPLPSEEDLRNGSSLRNGSNLKSMRSYEIPQAPKLKKTPPSLASKKGLVAPNGLSAREELMMAIRGTGGFQGLRKINSGKNL